MALNKGNTFENLVALGVFLPERVLFDAVMGEKLMNFHVRLISSPAALAVGCKQFGNSF